MVIKNSMSTYKEIILETKDKLNGVSSISQREVEMILEFLTKKDNLYFVKNPDEEIDKDVSSKLEKLVKKRKNGLPLEYIVHNKEFYGLNFFVNKSVLIPRPETELLVEEAFNFFKDKNDFSILDLGTGSGAIAVSLAKLFKDRGNRFKLVASDNSFKAIKIARRNATQNKVKSKIKFKESNWLENIEEKYDVIVSNPPYVKDEDIRNFPFLSYEPKEALFAGADGLDDIKFLLKNVFNYINDGGIFLCEFGKGQKDEIIKEVTNNHQVKKYEVLNDLAGIPRVLKAYL